MRDQARVTLAALRSKSAGAVMRVLRGGQEALTGSGKAIENAMQTAGVKNRVALLAGRYAPHALAIGGAKKLKDSDTVQQGIFRAKQWKAQRDAQKQQERGY